VTKVLYVEHNDDNLYMLKTRLELRMARQPAGGLALQALNRHKEALASYSQSARVAKGFCETHFNQPITLLTVGDFRHSFEKCEWRWRRTGMSAQRLWPSAWLGEHPLRGRTIPRRAGLGDCPWVRNVVWSSAGQGSGTPAPIGCQRNMLRREKAGK
jgi:hypothetical protein